MMRNRLSLMCGLIALIIAVGISLDAFLFGSETAMYDVVYSGK